MEILSSNLTDSFWPKLSILTGRIWPTTNPKADIEFSAYRPKADEGVYKILATTYCKLHFTQSLKVKTRLDIAKDI